MARPDHKALGEATRYDVKVLECSALEYKDVTTCFETVAKIIYSEEKYRAYEQDLSKTLEREIET